ncbi:MAG TPA: AI-2E family transporter [Cellvibrio sp.]|nr:AI-2E family transporter [Cellvibrio sp.]
MIKNKTFYCEMASYLLIAAALVMIITNGLLAALLAGTLVYSLVTIFSPRLELHVGNDKARMIMVGIIGAIIVAMLTLLVWGSIAFLKSENGNAQVLLQKLADIIDASRSNCPPWICSNLPDSTLELHEMLSSWLREHSGQAKVLGADAGHAFARTLIAMIIGAMISLHLTPLSQAPLAVALINRISTFEDSFKKIVFAQLKISGINTLATGFYILVILPSFGIHLPLAKTMIVLTFILGMMPIIGNLLSNTMIVIIALPFGLAAAVLSLLFLIVLHKGEYFLNAKIIGNQIKSNAWELLIAALVMEAIFGLAGVVVAPILYAYLKQELKHLKLI